MGPPEPKSRIARRPPLVLDMAGDGAPDRFGARDALAATDDIESVELGLGELDDGAHVVIILRHQIT